VFFVFTGIIITMRTATFDRVIQAEADDLLTTGESAALLNSSRQHVVDLCERGELPYTTIGTHRRIRRLDVEAVRTRTNRLTRDQRRSLWLAYATAGKIVEDPVSAINLAWENLKGMRLASRGQARRWLEEWERLLGGSIDNLLRVIVSPSPKSRELRQNSPFAGLLSKQERDQVLEAWRSGKASDYQ
jgi:excisionase family DNA binding protein